MTGHLVYVDQSSVKQGALEELREAMADLADFVEANEPDIPSYDVYFGDDGERMTVIHSHEDQSTLEHHMEVAGPKFPPIGEFLELESIDVYGRLTDDLEAQLREKASSLGSGTVTIHDHHAGVGRGADDRT